MTVKDQKVAQTRYTFIRGLFHASRTSVGAVVGDGRVSLRSGSFTSLWEFADPRLRPATEGALLVDMLGTLSFTWTGCSSMGSRKAVEELPFCRSAAMLMFIWSVLDITVEVLSNPVL